MDTNAHVLTQCEFQLQCECAKNSGKMTIFWLSTGLWHGHECTHARKEIQDMIMHVLCN